MWKMGLCEMTTDVTERCAHDDGVVAMLLVIVEDAPDRLDTGIIVTFIVLPGSLLVPVENLETIGLRKMTETQDGDDALDRRTAKSVSRRPPRMQRPGRSQRGG